MLNKILLCFAALICLLSLVNGACVSPQTDFNDAENTGLFEYQGGSVLTDAIKFNQIYYGDVWTNIDKTNFDAELQYFINNLGASDIYSYTAMLTDATGLTATTDISYGVSISYAVDPTLTEAGLKPTGDDVKTLVTRAVTSGVAGPASPFDIYGVTFGEDILSGNGLCNKWCAYHTKVLVGDVKIIFLVYNSNAFSDKCQQACSDNYVDGVMVETRTQMASVDMAFDLLFGQFISTVADSDIGQPENIGWATDNSLENFQLCENQYGEESMTASGEMFNVMVGTHMYHLQANVDATTQCCIVPAITAVTGTMVMETMAMSALPDTCGDLIVDKGEQCDDAGGCCSATCMRMANKMVCGTRLNSCWTMPKCKRGVCKASHMKMSKWGASISCNNGMGTCSATGECIAN